MTDLKDNLLASIKTGKIDMKPKWHFLLASLFFTSGLLVTLLIGIYLLSFVLFILRESGLWWTPGFGFDGFWFFVTMSPWLLILITVVFLATVYLLARHFGHNYRHRAVYTLLGVVLLVLFGASVIDYWAIHDRVRDAADNRHIPGVSPLYRQQRDQRPRDITPGMVHALGDTTITIINPEGEYLVFLSDAKRPAGYMPQLGDHIMVFGPRIGTSTINAKGIRPLPPPMERQLEKRYR
ncbi:MAG: hypothetical protein RLZZ360_153 [Candidatus Parcubacteria bacterium]|jgi:hypothetical protein